MTAFTRTAGTVPTTASFVAANGAAWSGFTGTLNSGATRTIQSNAGQLVSPATSYGSTGNTVLTMTYASNVELLASVSFTDTAEQYFGFSLRATDAANGAGASNGYLLQLNPNLNTWQVFRNVSSVNTQLGSSVALTFAAATVYNVRFRVTGSIVFGKVWTGAEPTSWTFSAVDSSPYSSAGAASIGYVTGNTAVAHTATISALSVTSLTDQVVTAVDTVTRAIGRPRTLTDTTATTDGASARVILARSGLGAHATMVLSYGTALRLFLRFGEPSGTVARDRSGLGRNGTYVGTAILGTVDPLVGDGDTAYAGSYTGGSYISVPYNVDFRLDTAAASAWSVEFLWAQAAHGGSNTTPAVCGTGNPGWKIYENASALAYTENLVGTTVTLSTPGAVPEDSAWRHFVVTFDGTTMRGYINGVLSAANVPSTPTALSNTTQLSINSYDGTVSGTKGNASIDEFAIYNTSLSASQVAALFGALPGVDSVGGSDAVARSSQSLVRTPTDINGTIDSPITVGSMARAVTETSTTTDVSTQFRVFPRNGSDATASSDTAALRSALVQFSSDVNVLSDIVTGNTTMSRTINESLVTADSSSRGAMSKFRLVTALVVIGDGATSLQALVRPMSDVNALTDVVAGTTTTSRMVSESLVVADLLARGPVSASRLVTALVVIGDGATSLRATVRPIADVVAVMDSSTRLAMFTRMALNDSGYIGDTYSSDAYLGSPDHVTTADSGARTALAFTRAIADPLGVTDNPRATIFVSKQATGDYVTITDVGGGLRVVLGNATDLIFVGDGISNVAQFYQRLLVDPARAGDTPMATLMVSKVSAESFGIVENLVSASIFSRSSVDWTTAIDTSITRIYAGVQRVGDALHIAEVTSRKISVGQTIADLVVTQEVSGRRVANGRAAFVQVVRTTDSAFPYGRGHIRYGNDIVTALERPVQRRTSVGFAGTETVHFGDTVMRTARQAARAEDTLAAADALIMRGHWGVRGSDLLVATDVLRGAVFRMLTASDRAVVTEIGTTAYRRSGVATDFVIVTDGVLDFLTLVVMDGDLSLRDAIPVIGWSAMVSSPGWQSEARPLAWSATTALL